jgi:uncharacterized protein
MVMTTHPLPAPQTVKAMYRLLAGPLSIEQLTIPIRGLPSSLQGLRLVQLTDFHFDGLRLSEQLLQAAIAACNAANPDLVLLTGDYITDEPQPIFELAEHLQQLQSRVGVYAVLGNHDLCYPDAQAKVTQALTGAGIRVLWDEVVYPLGSSFALVGLRDFWCCKFNPAPVMQLVSPEIPRIVLSHNPDSAEVLQQWRVDLQLSGHTHGGQVVVPGFGPVVASIKQVRRQLPKPLRRSFLHLTQGCDKVVRHWEWAAGLHQIGDNLLYTNRGLGTHLPGRFFCQPEVTIITLATL